MARTVAVGVGLVLALMLAGRVTSARFRPSVPPAPLAASTAATTASTPSTSTATPPTAVAATVAVGAATQVAIAAGSVWVGVWDSGTLVRVDPASNRVAARIPVGRPQESPIAIAATPRAVWVVNFGDAQVLRVDPVTNRVVARIPVRGGGGIAAGAGAVWVTSGEGGDRRHGWVQRIDPTRNRVVATIAIPSGALWDIAIDEPSASVWVGSERGGLWRIDAHTSGVTTIRTPGTPADVPGGVGHLVAGAGAVWVAGDGQLQRRDPHSGRILATIPWADGSPPARGAAGAGALWFSSERGLACFDVTTNRLVATIPAAAIVATTTLPDITGVAAGAGAVWVLAGESLLRVDPARVPR